MQKPLVQRIAGFAQRRAAIVFVIIAAISVFLGYFALRIRVTPDVNAILPNRSEAMKLADQTGQTFAAEYMVLAAESQTPLEQEKLTALADALVRLGTIEHVRGSINPFNFVTFAREGKRVAPALLGPSGSAPTTPEELATFRERISTDPLARNMVISKDGTTLISLLAVDQLQDYGDLLREMRAAVEPLKKHYTVSLAGSPPLIQASQMYLRKDMPRLLAGAIVVVLAVFFFGFRSKRSFFLPFLVVGLGALWTIGIMTLLGLNLSVVSLMVPPLVLVLGSSYSIHVLTQYYRDAEPDAPDKSWIPVSVNRIVQTVFLAAGTTVFGFLGLLTANIRQIREFGISASIGITLCALLALFFFPAVLSLLRTPGKRDRERIETGLVARMMMATGRWVLKWRYLVIAAVFLIAGGFALTIRTIRYDTNYMSYFRTHEPAVEETRFVIRKMGGYLTVRLTLAAPNGQQGYFLDAGVLRKVTELEGRLAEDPDVSYISSFTSYLREYNRALDGTFEIPQSRAPILAFSRMFRGAMASTTGRELVGELADDSFTRLTLVIRVYDSKRGNLMYEDRLSAFAAKAQKLAVETVGKELAPVVWGPTMVAVEVSEQLARDQISSSLISAALIFLLCSFSFRSLKFGLYTILPTVSGILANFLIMAALSIPLDIVTVMFTSVALGVGVDSAIHVIINYRRHRALSDDTRTVIENTLRTAGRPIIHTIASLVAGLLVLLASSFQPIAYFGILVSLAIVTTSGGSLVVLPAILAIDMSIQARLRRRKAERIE